MSKKTKYSLLILAMFVFAIFVVLKDRYVVSADASSASIKYLSGYAWSSNIGWINFSDTQNTPPLYQVTYNPDPLTGGFSGYAWSSNIGWISFGCGQSEKIGEVLTGRKLCSQDPAGGAPAYPTGNGVMSIGPKIDSDNKLVGFARACSVFESGCSGALVGGVDNAENSPDLGGWDGWISLSGDTSGSPVSQYGVNYDSIQKEFNGYAWGGGELKSQVPGWISFKSSGGASSAAYGVKMEDAPLTGTVVACERSSFPIVGVPITWTATVNPPGDYVYHWDINKDITDKPFQIVGGSIAGPSVTVKYNTEGGPQTTNVEVSTVVDGVTTMIGSCYPTSIASFDVSPLGFTIDHQGDLSAAYSPDRGITTYTYRTSPLAATIPITVSAIGDFTSPITLVFKRIEFISSNTPLPPYAPGTVVGSASASDTPTPALVVTAQFTNSKNPTPSTSIVLNNSDGVYDGASLRLILTKNQDSSASDLLLPSGDYSVIIDSSNGGHSHPIMLHISNPTGGVRER